MISTQHLLPTAIPRPLLIQHPDGAISFPPSAPQTPGVITPVPPTPSVPQGKLAPILVVESRSPPSFIILPSVNATCADNNGYSYLKDGENANASSSTPSVPPEGSENQSKDDKTPEEKPADVSTSATEGESTKENEDATKDTTTTTATTTTTP